MKQLSLERIHLKIFSWILLISLASCLTPIDISVNDASDLLVISGQISTLEDRNVVTIGTTSNGRLPLPLSGALIFLKDDLNNTYSYYEAVSNPGTYLLSGMSGVEGRTYHIEVHVKEKIYKSLPEKLPPPAKQDEIFYEITKEQNIDSDGQLISQDFIKVYSNSSLISNGSDKFNYLKWEVEEAFLLSPTDFPDIMGSIPPPCYIVQNADPQRVALLNGSQISSLSIPNQLVAKRLIDWTFLERHYFSVYLSSVTLGSYEYWNKVNVLSNQVGSIFDTPPAEITGNIFNEANADEKVLGYFQATNQVMNRFAVLPYDFPFALTMKPCTFYGSFNPLDYPKRCIDCTSVRNSSFNRPPWF